MAQVKHNKESTKSYSDSVAAGLASAAGQDASKAHLFRKAENDINIEDEIKDVALVIEDAAGAS